MKAERERKVLKLSVAVQTGRKHYMVRLEWTDKGNIEGRLSGKEKWNELPLHSEGCIRV